MSIFQAVFLGVVQGLTEFLPISSSGHLSVLQHFFQVNQNSLLFDVVLHLGTVAAVLIVYRKTIAELLAEALQTVIDLLKGRFSVRSANGTRNFLFMLVLACVPMLLLLLPVGHGRRLLDFGEAVAQDADILVEGVCFLFTAALLLVSSKPQKKAAADSVTPCSALLIGTAQLFAALFPGVSRSGSTVSVAAACGIKREKAVAFSFLLGIPAVLAASTLEIGECAAQRVQIDWLPLLCGGLSSALVGITAIRLLEQLVKKNRLKYFGFYCLAVGVVVIGVAVFEKTGL